MLKRTNTISKRFRIETTSLKSRFLFIKEGKGNRLETVTTDEEPVLILHTEKGTQKMPINGFIEVMGWKAIGNKLVNYSKEVKWNGRERLMKMMFSQSYFNLIKTSY